MVASKAEVASLLAVAGIVIVMRGLRLHPPPTKSGQTVADFARSAFTDRG